MYGLQAHDLINSICSLAVREFSTMGINFTVANEWYTALEFWNTMKESLSWEDLWIKVARPDHEHHTIDYNVMGFFNRYFKRPWGDGWEEAEYFFDWVAAILPTCDTIIVEGL